MTELEINQTLDCVDVDTFYSFQFKSCFITAVAYATTLLLELLQIIQLLLFINELNVPFKLVVL